MQGQQSWNAWLIPPAFLSNAEYFRMGLGLAEGLLMAGTLWKKVPWTIPDRVTRGTGFVKREVWRARRVSIPGHTGLGICLFPWECNQYRSLGLSFVPNLWDCLEI